MEHEASVREMTKVLEGAIDGMPEHLRPVLMLRDTEQLSVAETAQALDLREPTVKTRLHRARRFLRRALLAHFAEAALQVFEFGVHDAIAWSPRSSTASVRDRRFIRGWPKARAA